MSTQSKAKRPKPKSEKEIKELNKKLGAVLRRLKKPKDKQQAYQNWVEINKVTEGTGWISPDFDEPMELV